MINTEDSDDAVKEDTNSAEAEGNSLNESSETEPPESFILNESSETDSVETEPPASFTMSSKYLDPPAFIGPKRTYAQYRADLMMWSRITPIKDENQAEVVVYNLEGHSSGIKEKIMIKVGDKLENNKEGIKELVKYLDGVYKEDDMSDAWTKYKNFQKMTRKANQSIPDFIAEFEKECVLAKTAGCDYSDTILAFRLLEATNLTEMDEKFVLTGIDFAKGKTEKNLEEQFKQSLKKFQGRKTVTESDAVSLDPALVASVKKVLIADGWKKDKKQQRKRSTSEPPTGDKSANRNSSGYQGKKNPLGRDYKPLKCFKCNSEYHMADKCDNTGSGKTPKTEAACVTADSRRKLLDDVFALVTVDIKTKQEEHEPGIDAVLEDSNPKASHRKETEYAMVADTVETLCLLVEEAKNRGVLDSACSRTVVGKETIKRIIKHLPESVQDEIKVEESETLYQFGGGERRKSLKKISLPCMIGDAKVTLTTEVVDADIPLLIGTNALEKAAAVLHFGNRTATFENLGGNEVEMFKLETGHYCIDLLSDNMDTHINNEEIRDEVVLAAMTEIDDLSEKELKKLHHIWGHTPAEKLLNFLEKAGRLSKETKQVVTKIAENCEGCKKNAKTKPRPKASMPRADKFNQIVTMDIKEWDRNAVKSRYIVYAIDIHSRFTAAQFIPNKLPETVVEFLFQKWIGVGYGVPKLLHSDIGGEFSNGLMDDVASNLGIKLTTTASYSPHQNGVNERNHATVDLMVRKMLESDSNLQPERALFWALNAKNSLENCYGFSPYQLVFAANPNLPSVTRLGPPSYEGVSKSQAFVDNINALHSARQEFIKAESSKALKMALKGRIYPRGDDVQKDDWIYYQKAKGRGGSKIWRGPAKVVAENGKKLFIDQGARLSTVNKDDSVKIGEEFWRVEDLEKHDEGEEGIYVDEDENRIDDSNISTEETDDAEITRDDVLIQHDDDLPDHGGDDRENVGAATYIIKKGDRIKFRMSGEETSILGKVESRAGKANGKWKGWWNIENEETGEKASYDTNIFQELKLSTIISQ